MSFSFGLLIAINRARATNALSLIFLSPEDLYKIPFLSRKYTKSKDPVRLFLSTKGWSLIIM